MNGWVQVSFAGGSLDGQTRYVRHGLARGDHYEVIVTGEVWRWNGRVFELVWDGEA